MHFNTQMYNKNNNSLMICRSLLDKYFFHYSYDNRVTKQVINEFKLQYIINIVYNNQYDCNIYDYFILHTDSYDNLTSYKKIVLLSASQQLWKCRSVKCLILKLLHIQVITFTLSSFANNRILFFVFLNT